MKNHSRFLNIETELHIFHIYQSITCNVMSSTTGLTKNDGLLVTSLINLQNQYLQFQKKYCKLSILALTQTRIAH